MYINGWEGLKIGDHNWITVPYYNSRISSKNNIEKLIVFKSKTTVMFVLVSHNKSNKI